MAETAQQLENLATVIAIGTPTTMAETGLSQSLPTRSNVPENSNNGRKPREHRESETSVQSLPPPAIPHNYQRPPLNRGQSQIQMALNGSANFVGWNDTDGDIRRNWGSKRLRFLAKKYNLNQHRALSEARSIDPGLYNDVVDHPGFPPHDINQSHAQSENFYYPPHPGVGTTNSDANTPGSIARSISQASESYTRPRNERRESVARVAYGSAANVAKRGLASTPRLHRVRLSSRQSFDMDFSDFERAGSPSSVESGQTPETPAFGVARDVSNSARLAGEDLTRRTGSPIAEESSTDLSFFEQDSTVGVKQKSVPRVSPSHIEDFEMLDIGQPYPHITGSEKESSSTSDGDKLPQTTTVKPKLLSQERIDEDDLFFAFSTDDDQLRSRSTKGEGEGRPVATVMSLPKLPSLFMDTGCLSLKIMRIFFGLSKFFQLIQSNHTPSGSRMYRGGISAMGAFTLFLWIKYVYLVPVVDIGDGRLHIPIGKVALGPVPEEDRPEVNQPDRPLLEAVKPFVRVYIVVLVRSHFKFEIHRFQTRTIPRYPLLKQASVVEMTKKGVVEGVLLNLGHQSGKLFIPRYRRYRGIGALSTFYDGSLHTEKIDALNPELRDVIEKGSDERPLFTWWVTSVQVLICIVSLLSYGLGPAGWERVEMKEEVIDVSLALRQVSYFEPVNLWIGPRFADLIRLGAKYSPCMRREPGLWKLINEERVKENATGCCVFNDRTGCYQTGQSSCPRTLATWHKWSYPKQPTLKKSMSESSLQNLEKNSTRLTVSRRRGSLTSAISSHSWRTAGAVCGQDPDFCIRPSSVRPYEWPDDLTRWPICEQHRQGGFLPPHMTCQVTGRPCCIQMQGQCRIATREYCTFVKGHFHENATLCSQVNCFSDICGMLPFLWRDRPDQFYRMFFSLFLHAGIIHLAFTVWVQMWLMLDLEMLIGWKRMAMLYIGSGVGGNFASAIFVPYSVIINFFPEVGPSGSHLGIMAALVIDLYHHRSIIVRPRRELLKHMCTVLVLFLTGLLPWVDNWAHLFGFIFGLLITI
ncbi:peptidase, S54 family, partial [Necator americanus]